MILFLRGAFIVVLLTMLAVTGWASSQVALWHTPGYVLGHPWFVATLFDTYFAFLTFWAWVAYKEQSLGARIGWLAAILLFGNLAMASYVLLQLFRVRSDAPLSEVLLRRHHV